MKVEVEEAMELEDQLHKRFKHDPSLLAAMESGTEPVTESAMESVTKPPETIWKSIRDRVLRSSDLPLTSEKGYGMEYIFYPHWTNSDRLLIKIGQTGLDLNEVDREFAKLVPPPPPEVKTNLVLMICFFDKHPEKGYTFAWVRDFSSLYNAGKSYACDDDDDLIDDDPDEAEVDDPDKAEVDKAEDEDEDEDEDDEDEDEDEDEDDGDDFLYVVKSNRDPFDREDNSADRFGFRHNYERTLAARIRRVMSKRTECRYVFGFN
ncbi:nucleosome assembly protein 1;2-like isoform X4 [Quercus robur]|nr:nucleosome assembly protein 1;2-like isoform X4 [Quercus robur]